MPIQRPDIRFIPMSTDAAKIKFFGTLMPSLMLLKASPLRFIRFQVAKGFTPRVEVGDYIQHESDDAGRSGDVLAVVHRWNSLTFDPFTLHGLCPDLPPKTLGKRDH